MSKGEWKPYPELTVTAPEMEYNGKEKAKAPAWPTATDPFSDPIKPTQERPFSEQTLQPTASVPPYYGMEDEAARANHIEDVSSYHHLTATETNLVDPKQMNSKRRRLKRHCMRYWICYLICQIILLAITLPIIFLVIFPVIAQAIVDKQALQVHFASLMDPSPEMITIGLNATITVPKPFTVVLDRLNLSLFIRGEEDAQPYLYLDLPQNKLHGNASINHVERTRIVNDDQWYTFLNESVFSEEVLLSAQGHSMGHFGEIKAGLDLDKDVTIKGLNKLEGFGVTAAQLLVPPNTSGQNLKGTVFIPNYSPVRFQLGNQTFNMLIGDVLAGEATIYDLTLDPGDNVRTLYGTLDFGAVINNLEYILNVSAPALAEGNLRLWTTGKSTIYNGQHIPYYEKILGDLTLQADIPVTTLLIGSLGNILNGTAGGLQNIIDTIPAAILNGTIAISTLQTTLQQAYNNGTGSAQDITTAIGTVFTEAGQLDVGGFFTALGDAAGAVSNGAVTAGQIVGGLGTAIGNGATTLTDLINALDLSALIPTAQPGPT